MAKETKSPTGCRPGSLFGFWFILSDRLDQYVRTAQGLNVDALAKEHAARAAGTAWGDDGLPLIEVPMDPTSAQGGSQPKAKPYPVTREGIALIRIAGPTTKYTTSFSDAIGGTATVVTRRLIRMAAVDDDVRGVMVHLDDAPGGTVAGAFELADDLRALSALKPFCTHGDDVCCSAAVLFATSVAGRFTANRTGHVGSIGVLAQLIDTSGKAEKDGVRVIPIASGRYKAAGMPGTPVTAEHIADAQLRINALNEMFVGVVAAGRKLEPAKIKGWEARVFLADDAKAEGLIDDVCSFEQAVGAFASDLDKKTPTTGYRAPAGSGRTGAKSGINVDLPKLCTILGIAATMTEQQVEAHIRQMRTDLDARNAEIARMNRVPDADVLAERASTLGEKIDTRVEGGMPVPVADAIRAAAGLTAETGKTPAPVAAVLTPVPALGNKSVASWAVDLFKLGEDTGDAPAKGERTGAGATTPPAGAKVQPRNTPGGNSQARGAGGVSVEEISPERQRELLEASPLGQEVISARTSAANGNGR